MMIGRQEQAWVDRTNKIPGLKVIAFGPAEMSVIHRNMTQPPFAELEAGKNSQGNLLIFTIKMNDGTDCSPSYRQWTLGAGGLLKPGCDDDLRTLEKDARNYESEPFSEDY